VWWRGCVRNRRKHFCAFIFVGEQAQVNWASFGTVMVGRAR
jgi:hypothetical protein